MFDLNTFLFVSSIPFFSFLFFVVLVTVLYYFYRLERNLDLSSWRGLTIGHRGYRGHLNLPENSMMAFQYAYEQGAQGIEIDIMLTKDNKIVVMHDGTLDRTHGTTNKQVGEMTFEEIQSIPYSKISEVEYEFEDPDWNKNLLSTEKFDRVPSIEQIITFCESRGLRLMIELKEWRQPSLIRKQLITLFDKYNLYRVAYVATFNIYHLWCLRVEAPMIPTCLLYCRDCLCAYHREGSNEMQLPYYLNNHVIRYVMDEILCVGAPKLAKFLGLPMVGPQNTIISEELMETYNQLGVVVDVWVCNSPGEKSRLLELNCVVTTDRLFSKDADDELSSPRAASRGAITPITVGHVDTVYKRRATR